jgi:hypothetical protein
MHAKEHFVMLRDTSDPLCFLPTSPALSEHPFFYSEITLWDCRLQMRCDCIENEKLFNAFDYVNRKIKHKKSHYGPDCNYFNEKVQYR